MDHDMACGGAPAHSVEIPSESPGLPRFETVLSAVAFLQRDSESPSPSFLLKDRFGIYGLQEELKAMQAKIDAGTVPARSFASFMDEIGKLDPTVADECQALRNTKYYGFIGFYCEHDQENTSIASLDADRAEYSDADRVSKFSAVVLDGMSERLQKAAVQVQHWCFYARANAIVRALTNAHHRYLDTLTEAIGAKFGRPDLVLEPAGNTRALSYTPGQQAMGAHFDMTIFTALTQIGCDGLQRKVAGTWEPVHVPHGYILIQLGYVAQLLSGGHLKPMYHRVGPLSGPRFVCVYFSELHDDTALRFGSPLEHEEGITRAQAWEREVKAGLVYAKAFEGPDDKITSGQFNHRVNQALLPSFTGVESEGNEAQ